VNRDEWTPRQSLGHWAADRGHPALRFCTLPQRGQDSWIVAGSPSWEKFLATANGLDRECGRGRKAD